MKPSWQHAPDWANFLAQDEDGKWWWFECEPKTEFNDDLDGQWISGSRCEKASLEWHESLERRP